MDCSVLQNKIQNTKSNNIPSELESNVRNLSETNMESPNHIIQEDINWGINIYKLEEENKDHNTDINVR
jgi:hypothetical protein